MICVAEQKVAAARSAQKLGGARGRRGGSMGPEGSEVGVGRKGRYSLPRKRRLRSRVSYMITYTFTGG